MTINQRVRELSPLKYINHCVDFTNTILSCRYFISRDFSPVVFVSLYWDIILDNLWLVDAIRMESHLSDTATNYYVNDK